MINININLSAQDNITALNHKIKQLEQQRNKQELTDKAEEIQSYLNNYNTSDNNIYKLIIKGNIIIGIEKTTNKL